MLLFSASVLWCVILGKYFPTRSTVPSLPTALPNGNYLGEILIWWSRRNFFLCFTGVYYLHSGHSCLNHFCANHLKTSSSNPTNNLPFRTKTKILTEIRNKENQMADSVSCWFSKYKVLIRNNMEESHNKPKLRACQNYEIIDNRRLQSAIW